MHILTDNKDLDVIVPISLELDNPTVESTVADILEQHEKYGFTRFILATPCGGWRSVGYPPQSHFVERATMFEKVKTALAPYGISCGWWNTLTVKSGKSDDFVRITRADGSLAPFSSCPLDTNFQNRFAADIALFAKIAKPSLIILEDDYSIAASAGFYGCFCENHLAEFAKRVGKAYTREELVGIFRQGIPDSMKLLKEWRALAKHSLVALSKRVREEVDKCTPEIPIGYMQAGGADVDGDCTEEVSRALAGERHVPFSRLHGTFYCGGDSKNIPVIFHHALHNKQHIKPPFHFYHESDTFPHTRYFTSAAQMRMIMSTAYSLGFHGSTFQTQQLLDDPNEESAYGLMFKKERKRFNALAKVTRACKVKGVNISYDAFWNSVDDPAAIAPAWTQCVSRFGIPYTTLPASVAFLDRIQAKRLDEQSILEYLSKGVFLDGESAKILCERGFGEYVGVSVGEDVAACNFGYDLGAREIIRPNFLTKSKGRNMPIAHMYACEKNGKLLRLSVTDEKCEVISEAYNFQQQLICPAMVRFENKLGGKVVIMGMTVKNNLSQSLFNYRRKRLFEELLVWCDDRFVFVKDAPDVFCIMNECEDPEKHGFKGVITLTNLGDDDVDELALHLPKNWQNAQFYALTLDGEWVRADITHTDDGICLRDSLIGQQSVYLLIV